MLKEVRETRKFLGIARRSNGDIGARGRVVAFRVGDQQELQIVGELKVAVLAIIQIGLVNVLCRKGNQGREVDGIRCCGDRDVRGTFCRYVHRHSRGEMARRAPEQLACRGDAFITARRSKRANHVQLYHRIDTLQNPRCAFEIPAPRCDLGIGDPPKCGHIGSVSTHTSSSSLMRHTLQIVLLAGAACWQLPSSTSPSACSRRDALTAAVTAVAAACVGSMPPLAAVAAGSPKVFKSPELLQPEVVLILRVQEATGQETRLVSTGKYKELQRLNIKRAINMMVDNYDLRDRFVRASAYAPIGQQQQALSYGNTAVEGLTQILEYFPDKLVANDLTREQSTFVLAALKSVSKSIDSFLGYMPQEVVEQAKAQIIEENRLNEKEYEAGDGVSDKDIINKGA